MLKLEKALGTSVHRDVDKRSDLVALEGTKSRFVRYAPRGIISVLQVSAHSVTYMSTKGRGHEETNSLIQLMFGPYHSVIHIIL